MHNDVCTRVVKAAYPYIVDPKKLEELSFEKDEVMEAYDMKTGWWYAKEKTELGENREWCLHLISF